VNPLKSKLAFFIAVLAVVLLTSSSFLVCAQTQYVFGTDYYAPANVPMPAKGAIYTDPNFHISFARITDKSDGYSDGGIENEYAKMDAENCDGSFVILRANDAEYYLYDTHTFAMKKHLENIILGVEPEPRWDAVDPKIFYYVYGTELRSYNVDTDATAAVHDFKAEFPSASYITTQVEGTPSLDMRYWSFLVKDSDYNVIALVVYDKTANKIIGEKTSFPDAFDWVSIDMSGKHCVIGYDSRSSSEAFPLDMSKTVEMPAGTNGHMDFALTADGKDVMVYQNTATDWIAMADLDTGTETNLLKIPFDVSVDIGLHFSANCADKPGWVLVSTYGSKQAPPDQTHSWMDTQLFMLQLQPNPTIWRIAHTQAYTSDDYSGDKNYFAECYATINKAGTRIYFGSNWGVFTGQDYSDTYQATLPTTWPTPSTQNTSPTQTTTTTQPTEQPQQNQPIPLLYIVLSIVAVVVVVAVLAVVLAKRKSSAAVSVST
jgi:hypothetical protein